MPSDPLDGLDSAARLGKQPENASELVQDLYGELCKLETLQQAYAQIKRGFHGLGIDALTLETVEEEGVEEFLRQLSGDLQARIYQPVSPAQASLSKKPPEGQSIIALRDLVVQAALKLLLGPAFPPDLACDPEPDRAIAWVAGAIDRGLTRAYAVTIEVGLDTVQQKRLLEKVSQRVGDSEIVSLLQKFVAAPAAPGNSGGGPLPPFLADIAYEGIDRLLQQTRAVGREGAVAHIKCARWAEELVILLDPDPRYDWVLPAVKKRLREELAELKYSMDSTETQFVDLARGEKLRLLGYELRRVAGSQGRARVEYKCIEEPNRRERKSVRPRRPWQWNYRRLQFVGRYLSRARIPGPWHLVADAYHQAKSIQVGWRHLPITLYPVLALLLGWRSPVALLCVALIIVCNWRSIPTAVVQARRHWQGVTAAGCGIAALVCLVLLVSDLYAHLSREDPAPHMPPGFYLGQHNSSWDTEPVPYGIYVPPHFKEEKGPFPLIVFLHGYGERTKGGIFQVGVPRSIATQFGEHTKNGRFEFVAFFPIDPTGKWQTGTPEVEDAMKALDAVIQRHRIDPSRVYLTGLSNGGSGVWRLAEAYPDRWAAVAPISSFIQPDVEKVRHIPAWIYHGAKDTQAPVERERALVQKLKEVRTDIRYTEVPGKGHSIWREMYDSKDLYDWFAQKKRKD